MSESNYFLQKYKKYKLLYNKLSQIGRGITYNGTIDKRPESLISLSRQRSIDQLESLYKNIVLKDIPMPIYNDYNNMFTKYID